MRVIFIIFIYLSIISCGNSPRTINPVTAVNISEVDVQEAFARMGVVSVTTVDSSAKETQNKVKFDFSSKNQDELFVNKSGNNFQIYVKGLKDSGTFKNGETVVYTQLYFAFADVLSKHNSSMIKLQDSSLFRLKPSVSNDTLTIEATFDDRTTGGKGDIKFVFELKEKIDNIDIKYSKDKIKESDFIRYIANMTGTSTTDKQYKPLDNNNVVWNIFNDLGGYSIKSWQGELSKSTGLKPTTQPNAAIEPLELAKIVATNIVDAAGAANVNVEVDIPTTAPENKDPIRLVVKVVGTRSYLLDLEPSLEAYKNGKQFNLAPGDKGWDNK